MCHRFVFKILLLFAYLPLTAGAEPSYPGHRAASFVTQHFRIKCDRARSVDRLYEYGSTAEATRRLLRSMLPGAGTQEDRPRIIRVFSEPAKFLQAGGMEGSSGVFDTASGDILLLIPRSLPPSEADRSRRVLVHELTHQLLQGELGGLPPWLVEGLAVYIESIPFRDGRFHLSGVDFREAEVLRHYTTGQAVTLQLAALTDADRWEWNGHFARNPHGVNRQYLTAFLLTYHFIHHENPSKSKIPLQTFLSELKAIASGGGADADAALDALLRGRSLRDLEADWVAAFQREGFRIRPLSGKVLHAHQ